MKKTYSQAKAQIERTWHLVDLDGQLVGRVATDIATKLMGKQKPTYTTHIDGGDYVVVINAAKVKVSRAKSAKKTYFHHSHNPGGMKEISFVDLIETDPERIIREAVYSMLPKNRLRTGRMDRLKIFPSSEHPYGTHFAK